MIARLLSWLRSTPVIDAVSPPDPPEWDRELRQLHGLHERQRALISTTDDEPGNVIGYAWDFRQGRKQG